MVDELKYAEGSAEDAAHFQVSFHSTEKRLTGLVDSIFNVPTSSDSDQFNVLVNKVAENLEEEWEPTSFDFLIDNVLLRTSLLEFVEANGLSGERVIQVECILREPAPEPDKDLPETEWVAGLKTYSKKIFSVNYGGDISVWSLKGDKILSKKVDSEALKCIDLLEIDKVEHLIAGGQNQTLSLYRIEESTVSKKSPIELTQVAIFRGHGRSVECVAANGDGSRIVSGGFDNCLKVWDPKQVGEQNGDITAGNGKSKKTKISVETKTPMVTLESHREAVVGVKWNPLNEKQVVTVSWDHTMALWDLELAGTLSTLNSNKAFSSLSINPWNGLIVTGSTDPAIRMWDLRSREGSMVKSTFMGHRGWVSELCWSPDTEHLFVSSSFDNTVKMWDTRSPKAALYDLMGHEDRVLTVDWSDESTIVSGAADSTIKTFKRSKPR